jgi:hypothetical protein
MVYQDVDEEKIDMGLVRLPIYKPGIIEILI